MRGAQQPSTDLSGQVLGPWRLRRLVGEGAFGAVYEAQHETIRGRRAAVKVLHAHMSQSADIKRRFLDEASAASSADHENIIQVFDGGVTPEGRCYVAMELLSGRTLGAALQEGPLHPARLLPIALQIAAALDAAHARGIVHRDLKPENIFLIQRAHSAEFVKVLDFGIAKLQGGERGLTRAGTWLGTPGYMAPEQWMTLPDIDGRADLYALGMILFQGLTGRLPFAEETDYGWQQAHLHEPLPDLMAIAPGTPPALAQLVLRLCEKDRERRPRDAAGVIGALHGAVALPADPGAATSRQLPVVSWSGAAPVVARQISTLGGSLGERAGRGAGRPAAWASLGLLGVGVVAGILWCGQRPEAVERARAGEREDREEARRGSGQPVTAAREVSRGEVGREAVARRRPPLPKELAVIGPGPGVGRFVLGRYEVSLGEYRAFAEQQHLPPPLPWDGIRDFKRVAELPANLVTRAQAAAYCAWMYRLWGGRLPTEAEWTFAVRGEAGRQGCRTAGAVPADGGGQLVLAGPGCGPGVLADESK